MRLVSDRVAYLDNQATTPVDPRVRHAMFPFFDSCFGNPHSRDHVYGWNATDAVTVARAQVAQFIGADDHEILFTSGATESCNLALRGIARASDGKRNKLITVATEHPAVLETALDLRRLGFEVVVLPVSSEGLLDPSDLERTLDNRTLLVSIMAANNEIGVLQDLTDIAHLCHAKGVLFHTDATQAAGRIRIDVGTWDVDLLSLSAHKFYGPKGVGALFVRSGVSLEPMLTGGGQERGLRPGTVSPALTVGFGEACRIAGEEWRDDTRRMSELTVRLRQGLHALCPNIRIFGHLQQRLPGSLMVGFPGIPASEVISIVSDRIAVSTGSACASGTAEASKVLIALGVAPDIAMTGVRVSLGRFTKECDIETALAALSDIAPIAARNRPYDDKVS